MLHNDADLEDLDRKLKAQKEALSHRMEKESAKQSSGAYRMSAELVSGVVIGGAFGYGIDVLLGSAPAFLIVFFLVGFVAGLRNSIREVKRMQVALEENPSIDAVSDSKKVSDKERVSND